MSVRCMSLYHDHTEMPDLSRLEEFPIKGGDTLVLVKRGYVGVHVALPKLSLSGPERLYFEVEQKEDPVRATKTKVQAVSYSTDLDIDTRVHWHSAKPPTLALQWRACLKFSW